MQVCQRGARLSKIDLPKLMVLGLPVAHKQNFEWSALHFWIQGHTECMWVIIICVQINMIYITKYLYTYYTASVV
jgi:hypothetical protein